MSDGSLFVYNHGNEYHNIFPVWNWFLIPGTTVQLGTHTLTCSRTNFYGLESFVGGVTNGWYSTTVMNFTSNSVDRLKFRKGWFTFGTVTVAMVNGLSVASGVTPNIVTTLDQKWISGNVVTSGSSLTAPAVTFPAETEKTDSSVSWLWHDSVGYVFPSNANSNTADNVPLTLSTKTRSGDWNSIGAFNGPVSGKVFTATIRHNVRPITYFIVLRSSLSQFQGSIQSMLNDIGIISNTPFIMAAHQTSTKSTGIIFYAAGTVFIPQRNFSIKANAPCTIMISPVTATTIRLSVSDPSQLRPNLVISISRAVTCTGCRAVTGWTDVAVTLPTGEWAGSTRSIVLTSAQNWLNEVAPSIYTIGKDPSLFKYGYAIFAFGCAFLVFVVRGYCIHDPATSTPSMIEVWKGSTKAYTYQRVSSDLEVAAEVSGEGVDQEDNCEGEDEKESLLKTWRDV